ncbi:TlpA disulfide reductase family protein [Rhizobium laguerreae]|uniref:TlpA disulfide reductase family protein n=1 Tax=Rhizobium laguerreae TaxID=1076926 RepID=UPI001DDDCF66|nr:TlpA disulfide reductase family protein [Rhizobium laguerreae]MBY3347968.1 TlpA family protein disulfide reductase [Rhizobium laguerreae]MBY3369997.1 TlpA family protein disulfide reductase [Rhizobium laguerreae]MBY3376236.1 TlpA family protein disulfide reductase [Rhizobium laguerreae]MBY3390779.1 TlpA family protein disulfide reductase [Rhizobium laguerreae]MBY3404440.1 TlpA family protein disulfide reductase [Rhizobium laguerreae]
MSRRTRRSHFTKRDHERGSNRRIIRRVSKPKQPDLKLHTPIPGARSVGQQLVEMNSPAPSIKVQEWLRGDPISNFQLGNIYVLKFFSTSRSYCEPELSDLAKLRKKFNSAGVEFIGIAASEEAATADEARAQVDATITKSLPNTDIRIGFDHSGEMDEDWLKASLSFFPKTFIVDRDGSIAFIGDLVMLEDVLPKVIDGSWRASADAKNAEKERIAEGETYAAVIVS